MSILQLKFLQRIGTLTPINVVLAAADAWQTVVNKIQGQINYRAQVFRTGGAQENPKIWPLQAAFYHYLVSSNGLDVSDKLIFVKLDKKSNLPKI